MAKNNSFLITKPEIKFWLVIMGLIAGGIVAFNTLQMKVEALEETEDEIYPKIEQILINQAEMKKDIDYIREKIDDNNLGNSLNY